MANYLTHEELQHIEHVNKVLQDHLDLVNTVTSLSEEKILNMIVTYREYVKQLAAIQTDMGHIVKNIYASTREVGQATGKVSDIIAYGAAINKLNDILDDKLIEKIKRING